MPLPADPDSLSAAVVTGDRRALSRVISIIEDGRTGAASLISTLYRKADSAHVVGITGAPGAGKSTLTAGLIDLLRKRRAEVGVVAVDPSSPFTGGALLGDRVRMQRHASDPGVFIRSMSSRGHLGGLADATSRVVTVFDAAGFDPILVETVGVGQSEVEVMGIADTTLVVVTPGWGDEVQAAKAGLLEVGDLFVVNKADLEGADQVVRELSQMLELGVTQAQAHTDWRPPVLSCVAATGEGLDEVLVAIDRHRRHLSDRIDEIRRERAELEVRQAVTARLAARIMSEPLDPEVVEDVIARRLDPWTAAERLAP